MSYALKVIGVQDLLICKAAEVTQKFEHNNNSGTKKYFKYYFSSSQAADIFVIVCKYVLNTTTGTHAQIFLLFA